eukprot:13915738-Ditylum_brightwellii.AAC.1
MRLTVKKEEEWDGISKMTQKKVKEHTGAWFPFLDMKMKWESSKLLLRVYRKEDQQLKYIDQQSTHRPTTFKSTITGVYTRQSRLTSNSDSTAEKSINK